MLGDLRDLFRHQLAEELTGRVLAGGVGRHQLHAGQVSVGAVDAGVRVVKGRYAARGQGQGQPGGQQGAQLFFHIAILLSYRFTRKVLNQGT